MATLAHLVATGNLAAHEPDLDDDELPDRAVYFAPAFDAGFGAQLVSVGCLHGRKITPYEQVEQILYEFIIGRPMTYGIHYRKLDPVMSHVWELKTPDVRLFGWFPRKSNIVIVCGDLKDNLTNFKSYAPFIAQVVAFRDVLDLDEPKAITGVRHNEVL